MTHAAGSKDPMHGVTLKAVVTKLVEHYGWDELANLIRINCFTKDPSINSSLKFLRRTPWAREKVEALYLQTDWDNPPDTSPQPAKRKLARSTPRRADNRPSSNNIWPDWSNKKS